MAAVVVGVVARFVTTSPLWLDEALSVNIASLDVDEIAEALRHDGHPPLYYLMLHGWISVFGNGDVAVRALSGIISVAALPLGFAVGRRHGGARVGWLAVFVLAVLPFAARYATETRMYALVTFLVLLGWLAVASALERPSFARIAWVAIVSGLLLLTHYWAIWLLGAVILWLVIAWRRGGHDRRRSSLLAAVGVALGGVFFLPWLPSFLEQASGTGTPWAAPARPTAIVADTLTELAGSGSKEGILLLVAVAPLVLMAVAGSTVRAARAPRSTGVLLTARLRAEAGPALVVAVTTLALAAVGSYLSSSAFAGRYVAVIVPMVVVLVALGLHRMADGRVLACALALVGGLSLASVVDVATTDRSQAEALTAPINAEAGAGDLVVFCPDQLGPAGARALRDDLDAVTYPDLAAPEFVDWVDYAERNEAADPAAFVDDVLVRADGATIWLIWNGSYRTLEGSCEAVVAGLRAARAGSGPVVADDGANFFEHGELQRFPAS